MKKDINLADRIWTTKHLQLYLGISPNTAYNEIRQAEKQGWFFVRKTGRKYTFPRDGVLDYYEGRC